MITMSESFVEMLKKYLHEMDGRGNGDAANLLKNWDIYTDEI